MEAKLLIEEREERERIHSIRENNKKKEEIKQSRVKFLVLAAVLAAFLFFYLKGNAEVDTLQKKALSLKSEIKTLKSEQTELNYKLEEKKASPEIKEEAMFKLGMQHPSESQLVYINVDSKESKNEEDDESDILKVLIDNGLKAKK